MSVVINVHEAKTHLSKLLVRVQAGEEIVIAKAGNPIAKLVPLATDLERRVPGTAKGQMWISPDFDASLPDDMLDAFEGRRD